jgi:hypothetical protein
LSAQIIELGGNFSTSNQAFYKNAYGVNIGYVQEFKKQYIFVQYSNGFKNNTYSQVSRNMIEWTDENYDILKSDGTLSINRVKLGLAQKLISNNQYCISLGIVTSLNYAKFDESHVYIAFRESYPGTLFHEEKVEEFKNRFGYGAFLDMELKQVLSKRISLFSRIEVEDIELMGKNRPIGIPFQKIGYTSLEFMLGVRYNLKKSNE